MSKAGFGVPDVYIAMRGFEDEGNSNSPLTADGHRSNSTNKVNARRHSFPQNPYAGRNAVGSGPWILFR